MPGASEAAPSGALRTLAQVERDAIASALAALGGNHTNVARALGIGRNTLNRKIKGYKL